MKRGSDSWMPTLSSRGIVRCNRFQNAKTHYRTVEQGFETNIIKCVRVQLQFDIILRLC